MSKYDKLESRSVEQAKIRLLKEIAEWKEVFSTEDGKRCLALLKLRFYDIPEISGPNERFTIINAAQRDLVRYIIDRVEFKLEKGE